MKILSHNFFFGFVSLNTNNSNHLNRKVTLIAMSGGNSVETPVLMNGGVNNINVVHAQRKRMWLAEVYVHKTRKLDPDKDDQFDVFHIYEFDDNTNTRITPKLSTNCTEPRKIIDVLRNTTGSDTPQLQRLIEKLCAQSKFEYFHYLRSF